MASLNVCYFLGNLTRDPEIKYTPKGTAVCEVGLALNRVYTTESGEKREEVTFVDITAWGRNAEIIGEYLKKGALLLVECRASLDQWDDKTTGQKRSKIKFIVEKLVLMPKGGGAGGKPEAPDDQPRRQKTNPPATPPATGGQHTQATHDPFLTADGDGIPF